MKQKRRVILIAAILLFPYLNVGYFKSAAKVITSSISQQPPKIKNCPSSTRSDDTRDLDEDTIPDECEQALAELYAPIIYHSITEPNFPTNVDMFLNKTTLRFYDASCANTINQKILSSPSQEALISQQFKAACNFDVANYSNGTRSRNKVRTFFLEDIASELRKGSTESKDWYSYYHAYPNDLGGITIQYWRFYAYNTGKTLAEGARQYVPDLWQKLDNDSLGKALKGLLEKVEIGYHGGDWEGIHVVLNADSKPVLVRLLGHIDIKEVPWDSIPKGSLENTHIEIASEPGGHASSIFDDGNSSNYLRQETWTNGTVTCKDKPPSQSGPLINIGEKQHPLNQQFFIRYSGIWGSPSNANSILPVPININPQIDGLLKELRLRIYYASSGYWGPAYNETEMDQSGLIKAWCPGRKTQPKEECYPTAVSP